MAKYLALCTLSLFLFLSGCSKKDSEPVKTQTDTPPPVDNTPTFNFTVTVAAVTDSSAAITLNTTNAKQSDVLKYAITLNNKTIAENQQGASYIIKKLTAETSYEGKVELKDQHGNVKSQPISFQTLKYYLKFIKTYDVAPENQGDSFIQTPDGGYVISGFASASYKEGIYGNSYNNEIITLLRVDKFGNKIWSNSFWYDNRFSVGHTKYNVVQLADGGFVVNGSSAIVKVDANGHRLWEHYFPRTGLNLLIRNVSVNKDNTIMVVGYGDAGALIYKFSSDGKLIWENHFFDKDEKTFTSATAIAETNDHGFIVIGEYAGTEVIQSYYAKLDDRGNVVWLKRFPITGTCHAKDVKAGPDGTFTIITDILQSRPRITTITPNGDVLMTADLNITEYLILTGFDFTPDGYILSGIYVPPFAGISNYWMLIKTDKQGKIIWKKRYTEGNCYDVKYIDEGFVASGSHDGPLDYQIKLMKVDKDGNN
ncbi:hypothetical protein [Mucilaginibacter lacusdianchii]|uniref:hypothetical protein n=1 Tax=Mucilaginibacter lacusdianchii TaxID=2684211 RepID=UPI00131EBD95|nr:hypothetical protein [Mucilaginibacter sp. JXJ CY 39]